MDDLDSRIFTCVFLTNPSGLIGRTVIHYKDFQIMVCLITDTVKASYQVFFNIVSRNNHRNPYIFLYHSSDILSLCRIPPSGLIRIIPSV